MDIIRRSYGFAVANNNGDILITQEPPDGGYVAISIEQVDCLCEAIRAVVPFCLEEIGNE